MAPTPFADRPAPQWRRNSVATWCLVVLGAAVLFLGIINTRFADTNSRLEKQDQQLNRIESKVDQVLLLMAGSGGEQSQ